MKPNTITPRPALAVFRKELASYFANPTAYVFITVFVFLSGVAAFWNERFFDRNLANLDTLNAWFPALLLFLIPAITMSSWAEERKQGTDELLMTLPAAEWQLLGGKLLGCWAIYATCLAFAATHAVVLAFLGRPDIGLVIATYLGYLFAGCALCGVGLAASTLSANPTISFIASAAICGLLIGIGLLADLIGPGLTADALRALSVPYHMESFGRGVIDLADIAYFVAVAGAGLLMAVRIVCSRRRPDETAGNWVHSPIRGVSLAVALAAAVILLGRFGLRADATAERLWTVDAATREVIRAIPADQPVAISAYVSPRVPTDLVQQRETLLGLLREIESISGGKVMVRVIPAEPNTEAARDAERAYGIRPRDAADEGGGVGAVRPVFLGVAVSGGAGGDAAVIPFLGRGLSAEYELARAIRAAGTPKRKRIGVLDTQAGLYGSFDFQTMAPARDWPIIEELRKQYDVQRVSPAADIPADIDVLLVAQPSTLAQDQLARLVAYVTAGRAAVIFEDTFPIVNPQIATAEPRQRQNPMMGGPEPEPKANLAPLYEALGARVTADAVVFDTFNPHPQLSGVEPEFIWVARRPDGAGQPPFNPDHAITAGLQEVVLLFAGRVERLERSGQAAADAPDFIPLMRSGPASNQMPYASLMQRSPFGGGSINRNRRPVRLGQSQVLAAAVSGGKDKINAILVGDLDMISETFFRIRESGIAELEFDNVTFVLNAVDHLAGDKSLVELRKKRRVFRTLEAVERRRQEEIAATKDAELAARADAEARLAEAQARLDGKVREVEARTDLDDTTKRILVESTRAAEQRRLSAQSDAIQDEQNRAIEDARLRTRESIDRIQMTIRAAAVALPPIPALAIGAIVLIRRRAADAAGRAPAPETRP